MKLLIKRKRIFGLRWKKFQLKKKAKWLRTYKKSGQSKSAAFKNAKRIFKIKFLHASSTWLGSFKLTKMRGLW